MSSCRHLGQLRFVLKVSLPWRPPILTFFIAPHNTTKAFSDFKEWHSAAILKSRLEDEILKVCDFSTAYNFTQEVDNVFQVAFSTQNVWKMVLEYIFSYRVKREGSYFSKLLEAARGERKFLIKYTAPSAACSFVLLNGRPLEESFLDFQQL